MVPCESWCSECSAAASPASLIHHSTTCQVGQDAGRANSGSFCTNMYQRTTCCIRRSSGSAARRTISLEARAGVPTAGPSVPKSPGPTLRSVIAKGSSNGANGSSQEAAVSSTPSTDINADVLQSAEDDLDMEDTVRVKSHAEVSVWADDEWPVVQDSQGHCLDKQQGYQDDTICCSWLLSVKGSALAVRALHCVDCFVPAFADKVSLASGIRLHVLPGFINRLCLIDLQCYIVLSCDIAKAHLACYLVFVP